MRSKRIKRRCGACTACCVGPSDPSQDVCCRGGVARPAGCGGFECLWLMGYGKPSDRPDRVGLVLAPTTSAEGRPGVIAFETTIGASETERAAQLVRPIAQRVPVLLAEHAIAAPGVGATMLTLISPRSDSERRERVRSGLGARSSRRRGRRIR